jgi:hypothetical protein
VNRQALKKRLFLTTIIYILSAGIALANSGCLLACCKHCESQSMHHGSTPSGHDRPHDCSPGSKSSSCHCLSNFNVAVQNVDFLVEYVEEGFTAFNLTAATTGAFSPNRTNHYFAYLKTLQIKIPPIPLYLSNLSLLF